jgi:diadenosine tetraphosphate (Ap4A) HIT family hydrolase
MYRSRAEKKFYFDRLAKADKKVCVFCNPPDTDVIETTKHFRVIRNIFPYSFWDFHQVTDHLMIVPRQHIESISKLPEAAKAEFANLVGKYEGKGYDIFGRRAGSSVKTIPHQHTHCIKTNSRSATFLLFLRKPYLRWVRWR